jgi:ABC-type nitrate/sulfonate/bicarbonate transport system permease component
VVARLIEQSSSQTAGVAGSAGTEGVGPRRRRTVTPVEIAFPVAILAAWQLAAAMGLLLPTIFPAPLAVVETLVDLTINHGLAADFLDTLKRILIGFAIGASVGVFLGGLVGYFRLAERVLDGTVQALRSVPAVAWIPFLIITLGIEDRSKIAILAIATFFPVYVNAFAGVRGTDQKLIELARAYRLPRSLVVRQILLPSSLPQLFVGLRLAAGISWIAATFSEILFGNTGLGVVLNDGRSLGRPDQTVAVMLILALAGKGTDSLIRSIERRVTSWRSTFDGVGTGERRSTA